MKAEYQSPKLEVIGLSINDPIAATSCSQSSNVLADPSLCQIVIEGNGDPKTMTDDANCETVIFCYHTAANLFAS